MLQPLLLVAVLARPASVDLEPSFEAFGLGPRAQGDRPTCSVFVVAHALEFAAAKKTGRGRRLSVEFLNWASNDVTGTSEDGSNFLNLWNGLQRHGVCAEETMPYQNQSDRLCAPTEEARAAARKLLALGFQLHWIKEWDPHRGLTDDQLGQIRETLAAGRPVCGGFLWPKQQVWKKSTLQMCPRDAVRDGHSVLLVGYRDDATLPGGGVFLIRNSSGNRRDGLLTYEYVKAYTNDAAWVECTAPADPNVTIARADREHATGAFTLEKIPPPVHGDAGTKATFRVVDGRRDRNGGDVSVLHDSRLPNDEDQPSANFFFAAGTDGGRLLVDLGRAVEIKQVNTYSWHPDSRGPQVYDLYASTGSGGGFNAQPKRGTDPASCGYERIAAVDTRSKETPDGGQYGVSIAAAQGSLGSYRYLLFDMRRTTASHAFGNTFYSEIDIIDAKGGTVVPISTRQPRREIVEVTDGTNRITIDVTDTPDLAAWVRTKLAPVVKEWYPKIIAMLPSTGYTAPRRVSIVFSNTMRGVAATGGTRVRCAASWYRRNLKGEALGSVVHELVHVVQQYRGGRRRRRTPGWLVEGIADYIRWFKYEPETRGAEITRRNLARARYDASYRISANFINWVTETHATDIVVKLNAAAREGRYSDELWKQCTGRALPELAAEWKKFLEKNVAGSR